MRTCMACYSNGCFQNGDRGLLVGTVSPSFPEDDQDRRVEQP